MEAPTGISFTSLTVNQLKEFLKERGVTVANNMNKQNLVCLCEAAKNLDQDPNLQNCNSWRIIERKLADIGVFKNPLLLHYLPSFTPSDIPEFGLIDIFNYLLFSRADYDQKKLKAYKSFDDYRLFEDGHVRSLELSSIKDYFVFRAAVLPTCKTTTFLNQSSYNCWFILNTDGEIFLAYCQCMGG